jgi:hypothetical protein
MNLAHALLPYFPVIHYKVILPSTLFLHIPRPKLCKNSSFLLCIFHCSTELPINSHPHLTYLLYKNLYITIYKTKKMYLSSDVSVTRSSTLGIKTIQIKYVWEQELRKMSGPKKDKVKKAWSKVHNEIIYILRPIRLACLNRKEKPRGPCSKNRYNYKSIHKILTEKNESKRTYLEEVNADRRIVTSLMPLVPLNIKRIQLLSSTCIKHVV